MQGILQLLPITLKSDINKDAQNNIIRLPLEINNKIKNQLDNEDEQNAYLRKAQYLAMLRLKYTNKHPNTKIELINGEDSTVLNLIFEENTIYNLNQLFNIHNKTIEDISAIIGRTIENNSILKELQQYFVIIKYRILYDLKNIHKENSKTKTIEVILPGYIIVFHYFII